MSSNYDVLVIGAGIIGSSTAYSLTKRNVGKVLLLEQFEFLHKSNLQNKKKKNFFKLQKISKRRFISWKYKNLQTNISSSTL